MYSVKLCECVCGQEKIKLCMAKMSGSANHSIKQVSFAEEEVNKSDQGEPFLLQVEMEELSEEVQISVTAKEVIEKPTMHVKENPLFVPELMVDEDEVTQGVVDENQSHLDQLMAYRS